MRTLTTALVGLLIIGSFSIAGDDVPDVNISGFIKFDGYYDTHQTTSAREGHFLLYPKPAVKDADGNDINAVSNINMVNFQSRIRVKTSAQEALGAKVSGLIEADFFGASGANENELRLRHATVKLDWGTSQLLIGQYWSPLFTTSVYPGVVSFNTGMPFQPFARNPQVRFTTMIGTGIKLVGAASMQRDAYQESGGRSKQQISGIPGLHLQAEVGSARALAGVGGHQRFIRHSLTCEVMPSAVITGYGKLTGRNLILKGKMIYGGDMTDQLMLGGYLTVQDTVTGVCEHTPLNTLSSWIDIGTTGNSISLGLFAGYSTNMGSAKEWNDETDKQFVFSARSPEISGLWRISPRAVYNSGKLRFAFEVEITSALYTSDFEASRAPKKIAGDERVTNIRGLFATYLFF